MKKIQKKYILLAGALFLSITIILFLSFHAYNQALSQLKEQFNAKQKLVLKQTAFGLEKQIDLLVRELEILSETPAILNQDIDKARRSMEHSFDYVKEIEVKDLAFLDANGIAVIPLMAPNLVGADFSYRNYFKQAKALYKKKPVYEFITFQGVEKGRNGIIIAMPVFSPNREFKGVILLALKVNELINRFIPIQKASSIFWVMERNGSILYHPHYEPGAAIDDVPNRDITFRRFLENIKSGKDHHTEYIRDGVMRIAASASAQVAGQEWILILDASEKTVRDLVTPFSLYHLLATSAIILTIIGCAFIAVYSMNKWNLAMQQEVLGRKRIEDYIRKQNSFLHSVIESLPFPFYVIDSANYLIVMANSIAAPNDSWRGKTCYQLTHSQDTPCDGENNPCLLSEVKKTRKPVILEHIHFDRAGQKRHVAIHGYPIFDMKGNIIQVIESAIDITEQKQMEEEREGLILSLQEALSRVKLLSGFLPICVSCKNIRDDKGHWTQLESYIHAHSEAEFSHGLCPNCYKKEIKKFIKEGP